MSKAAPTAILSEQEQQWAKDSPQLAQALLKARQHTADLMQVAGLTMMQQQAYHRLLGSVFVHHKDCLTCRPQMQAILEMIAQNIEHLDSLLPEAERAKVPAD